MTPAQCRCGARPEQSGLCWNCEHGLEVDIANARGFWRCGSCKRDTARTFRPRRCGNCGASCFNWTVPVDARVSTFVGPGMRPARARALAVICYAMLAATLLGCVSEHHVDALCVAVDPNLVVCDVQVTNTGAHRLCATFGGTVAHVDDLDEQRAIAEAGADLGLWWSGHGRWDCEVMGPGGASSPFDCSELLGVVCEVPP